MECTHTRVLWAARMCCILHAPLNKCMPSLLLYANKVSHEYSLLNHETVSTFFYACYLASWLNHAFHHLTLPSSESKAFHCIQQMTYKRCVFVIWCDIVVGHFQHALIFHPQSSAPSFFRPTFRPGCTASCTLAHVFHSAHTHPF